MRGQALAQNQVSAHLQALYHAILSHGKQIDHDKIKEWVIGRLVEGPPFIEDYFKDFEVRDFETLLGLLDHEEATRKALEKNPELGKAVEREPKNKEQTPEIIKDPEPALATEATPEEEPIKALNKLKKKKKKKNAEEVKEATPEELDLDEI